MLVLSTLSVLFVSVEMICFKLSISFALMLLNAKNMIDMRTIFFILHKYI